MEGRISRKKVETITRRFRTWGWGAILLPAILPPPFPASPFFFAAGALKYPLKKSREGDNFPYFRRLLPVRFSFISDLARLFWRVICFLERQTIRRKT